MKPDPEGPRPLADIRVLAVEQYGAGPYGSMLLADLGAEVIKIEDPASGGDVARYVPPYRSGEDNLFFESLNRNKSSIALDLNSRAGRQVFRDLAGHADAVYSNLRGDVPQRLGLTYDQLAEANPQIVCCALSAFGTNSSMRREPGYDYVIQGMTGWMSLTGEPDGPPTKTGLSLVDFSSGMAAAFALLAGVHAARRDGQGMDCGIALYDVALSMLNYLGTWHLTAGHTPVRTSHSAHPTLVPFQNFRTANGWIVLGCAKEKFWDRLVDALDSEELRDPQFKTFADRHKSSAQLLPILERLIQQRPSSQWLSLFRAAGVPCAPILDVPDALAHPMAHERDMILSHDHPTWGVVSSIASPLKVGSRPTPKPRRAPRRGEDTSRVLHTVLGLNDADTTRLDEAGAFGSHHPVHEDAGEPR